MYHIPKTDKRDGQSRTLIEKVRLGGQSKSVWQKYTSDVYLILFKDLCMHIVPV